MSMSVWLTDEEAYMHAYMPMCASWGDGNTTYRLIRYDWSILELMG